THSFDYLKDRKNIGEVFQLLKRIDSAFVDLGVIDSAGNQVAYRGPYPLEGKEYGAAEWFQTVMTNEVYISDVFLGLRKIPHFIIAVKRVEMGRPWILRATIDIGAIKQFMSTALSGTKGDVCILSREGIYQICGREHGRILTKADFKVPSIFEGIREMEGNDPEGEPVLYAMAWLKNNDWLMVIEENLKDELGPMIHVKNTVLIIFVVSSLIIIVSTVLVTRRLIGGLERIDRERSERTDQLVHFDKLAAIGKLASGVAHEINNPLAVIAEKAGWMEDLLSEEEVKNTPDYDELLKSVQDIKKHVNRGKKITHRLLGFARRTEIVYEELDIHSIMDETVYFLEREAGYRNIDIIKEYGDAVPRIFGDGSQLQQVFINVLNNAIDAIDKNGKIYIKTESQDKGILVSITDTGPGISEKMLGKIFEPFYTSKPVGKGTGLGLSTSYGIVKKLGGRMTVESEVGKGTTFHVVLPLAQTEDKRQRSEVRR
ncbi:MAG: GHKL domain-containing protein, partial [Deltaproteobacteria bacterium]|nr:GHKL domain-containing protein [Deltaproteobacteria bacterium]